MAWGGRRAQSFVVLALGASALSACASNSPETSSAPQPAPAKPSSVAVGPVAVAPATPPGLLSEPVVTVDALPKLEAPKPASGRMGKASETKPQATLATLPQGEGLKRLVGLDRNTLENTLGPPWLVRREVKTELWQYRAPNCVLDLFFYAKSDGELHVTHADLRGRRENRPAPAGCFAEIVGGQTQKAEAEKPQS